MIIDYSKIEQIFMFVDRIKQLKEKGTPGPWAMPHFVNSEITCNCDYVVSETCLGSVARISLNNGKAVGEGGNDCPMLEEAIANAERITSVPEMEDMIIMLVERLYQ